MSSMVQRVVFLAVIAGSLAVHAQSKGNCGKPPKFQSTVSGAGFHWPDHVDRAVRPLGDEGVSRASLEADGHGRPVHRGNGLPDHPRGAAERVHPFARVGGARAGERDPEARRGEAAWEAIRVAGWVRAEGLTGDAGLWLSVDGGDKADPRPSTTVGPRADKARDWIWSEVVLDVPSDATTLSFGLGLGAAGQAG